MTYSVKEIFKTLQGEGYHTGRVAVFCRFAGCNLWTGREEDRADAKCKWCDTDFVGGEKFETAEGLAEAIQKCWGDDVRFRYVVFTGGEPLLQLDDALIEAVLNKLFKIGVETNGTLSAPRRIQWLCVSPKAGTEIKQRQADELKVVYPQEGLDPEQARGMIWASRWTIQPMDGPRLKENMEACVQYCMEHPDWRLSLQTHKILGIR